MATFTMELSEVIELTGGDIGLNDYPIFDPDYRETLNQKIIDHYYNQEIGSETISMFRLSMKRKMNEIMPYYNQLYQSEALNIDPLFTVDVRSESNAESNTEQTSNQETTTTADSKSRAVASEMPQVMLSGNEDYATNASDSTSNTDTVGGANEQTSATGTQATTARTYGTQGSQADMLMRYRETFLNIDLSIIQELSELFMAIWNTSDDYTGKTWI